MKKTLAIILVVFMLITVFAGCGGGSESSTGSSAGESSVGTSSSGEGTSSGTEESKEFPFKEGAFKGQTLKWWNNWTQEDPNGTIAEFENKTGAKIEYSHISGNGVTPEYYGQAANAIAAGTGPDVLCVYDWAAPSWIRKGLLNPLTEVMDLKNDEYYKGYEAYLGQSILDFFSYEGEYYGWNTKDVLTTTYMVYRKDLIEEAGLDDPYELWENGEWTYDKFNEMMLELTYDSNDDGVVDKFGCTGYLEANWFGTVDNGDFIRWNEDGSPRFALTDDDMLGIFEQMRWIQQNCYLLEDWEPVPTFCGGNVAFMWGAEWYWKEPIETFGIENLGFVEFPKSSHKTDDVVLHKADAQAFAVTNNMDCPDLVEHYFKYLVWEDKNGGDPEAKEQRLESVFGGWQELMDFDAAMRDKSFIPHMYSFGGLLNLVNTKLIFDLESGSVSQLAQGIAQTAQNMIDDTWFDLD